MLLGGEPHPGGEVPRALEGIDSSHLRVRRGRRQQPDAGDFHRSAHTRIGACLLRQRALEFNGARINCTDLLQERLENRAQLLRQQGALIVHEFWNAFQGHARARGVWESISGYDLGAYESF